MKSVTMSKKDLDVIVKALTYKKTHKNEFWYGVIWFYIKHKELTIRGKSYPSEEYSFEYKTSDHYDDNEFYNFHISIPDLKVAFKKYKSKEYTFEFEEGVDDKTNKRLVSCYTDTKELAFITKSYVDVNPFIPTSKEGFTKINAADYIKIFSHMLSFAEPMEGFKDFLKVVSIERKDGKINFAASQGGKLAFDSLPSDEPDFERIEIPTSIIQSLLYIATPSSNIYINKNHAEKSVSFIIDNIHLSSSAMTTGRFPNIERVFPVGDCLSKVMIPKSTGEAILELSNQLAKNSKNDIRTVFKFSDKSLTIERYESEPDVSINLEVESSLSADIGFYLGYISDVINSYKGEDIIMYYYGNENNVVFSNIDATEFSDIKNHSFRIVVTLIL